MSEVALLGVGRMGSAMARSLSRNGHALVLYNRSPEKAQALASELGASVAGTAAEAVARSAVAISMVSDEAAVEALYRGPDGVLDGLSAGTVLLEMSTVPPHVVQGLEEEVRSRGGAILDAPVSGSVALAEAGTLTIMAGGEAGDLERARPVLEGLSAQIFHMGPLGTGATIKLAVNSIIFGLNQILAEALVLAEKAGVERATAYEVFANSAIAAPYTKYKQAAFVDPEGTPVAFSLGLAAKDLDLILTLARAVGATMAQTEVNLASVTAAADLAGADADLSAVALPLRDPDEP
jgi:3-hydroxyisobutyrate dehydrogenase-like beta-hydroxyacid dehydrogenase